MSEDDVKRAMVPFLREFYRYRYEPRPGSEVATLDNVSADGLVADVLMHFRRDDGTQFLAACEATARGQEDEVRFKLDRVYFIWDCIAFAAAFTTVLYAIFYITRPNWLISLAVAGNSGLLIGLALIVRDGVLMALGLAMAVAAFGAAAYLISTLFGVVIG